VIQKIAFLFAQKYLTIQLLRLIAKFIYFSISFRHEFALFPTHFVGLKMWDYRYCISPAFFTVVFIGSTPPPPTRMSENLPDTQGEVRNVHCTILAWLTEKGERMEPKNL
jgi:hypothetical protein